MEIASMPLGQSKMVIPVYQGVASIQFDPVLDPKQEYWLWRGVTDLEIEEIDDEFGDKHTETDMNSNTEKVDNGQGGNLVGTSKKELEDSKNVISNSKELAKIKKELVKVNKELKQ